MFSEVCMIIQNLVQYRKEKKLSQEEIAKKIGISKYQYSIWEKKNDIPIKYIGIVSEILGYSFSSLFTPDTLKGLRVVAELKQHEMAEMLGITQQSYLKWELGKSNGYTKYEEILLSFFKKILKEKPVLPMHTLEVPGATILTCLDNCYILIDDETKFDESRYLFHPKMKITKYKYQEK